jgi:hypothetical protein
MAQKKVQKDKQRSNAVTVTKKSLTMVVTAHHRFLLRYSTYIIYECLCVIGKAFSYFEIQLNYLLLKYGNHI